ncbi:MAG TPA: bifunctional riboflavin kinase/FAD synthetase [Salinisphaeraceae bacterium]|nr:bifunctional riboflavin kinase/FAD synthetase [Salinisphaeraceae bacterium]
MQLVRNLTRLHGLPHGCALTIGNFDGLHRGHQAMIERLCQRATELAVPAVLMTFDPMPLELFCPDQAPAQLSSLREKIEDARTFGVDIFVRVPFNRAFAALDAQTFMQDLLVAKLNVRYVIVGEDFHFSRHQEGDVTSLREFADRQGFEVVAMPAVAVAGGRVSSTRIRQALAGGDVALARRLLGRDYRISGRVIRGQQLGRTLGFPTVNLRMCRRVAPQYGVYAVRVLLADGSEQQGAASLGVRPTVSGNDCLLEVFLLDFERDLYGQRISVFFVDFIRPEIRFDSLTAMTRQMHEDVAAVRATLDS